MKQQSTQRFPKVGMRTFKTAVAVTVCFLFFEFLKLSGISFFLHFNSFYAGAAAIICMQGTVEKTVQHGVSRVVGTLFGGFLALLVLFIKFDFAGMAGTLWQALLLFGGVILCITVCNMAKRPDASAISCVVFVVIFLFHGEDDRYVYALMRVIETCFGIFVAILVNKFLARPSFGKKKGLPQDDAQEEPEENSEPGI